MTKRHTNLGNITGPALAISAANVAASAIDPIFPALKDYLRLHDEWYRLGTASERAKDIARDGRCIVPPRDPKEINRARDAADAAADRVTDTTPTTIAGVAALIRFVMDDPTNVFDFGQQEWPRELFVAALAGLDNITAGSGLGASGAAS